MDEIQEAIAKRHGAGRIGLAYDYLSTLEPCLDGASCAKGLFEHVSIKQWEKAVKAAKSQLVYRDEGMIAKSGLWLPTIAAELGIEQAWTKDAKPAKLTLTPKACMDFECIVTTTRKDRDGDILETGGSEWGDPPTPLLWQHLPMMPIGKVVKQLRKTNDLLTAHCSIADTQLGRDTAFLVDFGALGISHGFKPKSVEPLPRKSADDEEGFRVKTYRIVEVSTVSVRSNEDAIITAASREKLHHPLVKAYAQRLKSLLPKMVVGGYEPQGVKVTGAPTEYKAAIPVEPVGEKWDGKYKPINHLSYQPEDTGKWNRRHSKAFDVADQKLEPANMTYDWVSQYLETPVKHISQTGTYVPSVRLGTWLTGFQEMLRKDYALQDVRNLCGNTEAPPHYENIQLNSKRSDTFLVRGTAFYKGDRHGLVIDYSASWGGVELTLYAADEHRQKLTDMIDDAWKWARDNNMLKGEAFALSGEFLTKTDEDFDNLFLDDVNAKAVRRVLDRFNAKGKTFNNHGMIFSGPPGTGKTLSCRIMLNKAQGTYLWVSARDFYHMGSFGGMSMAFDMAKELAPAIIVLEDADNWIDRHTVDYLKSEMDGVGRSKGILTILTTNFPETLPEALIDRPGRFHDVLQFALPTRDARHAMLTKWLGDLPAEKLAEAADATDGYSGAHLYHLARFAEDLRESEEAEPEKALEAAIKKVEEQRELINGIQLEGSRYRPNKDLAAIQAKAATLKYQTEGTMKKTCECKGSCACKTKSTEPPTVKACQPVVIGRKRHGLVAEALKLLDTAHDSDELKQATIAKTAIQSAKALIQKAVKPPEDEDEQDEDEDGKKVEYTILKDNGDGKKVEYTILKEPEARCGECGGPLKDGVCSLCGKGVNPEAGPEANPGITPDANPGAGKAITAEHAAGQLMAKLFAGERPAWDTLHMLKGQIDDAIQSIEQTAAVAACG